MRITGGKARGIPLKAPKGDATRPATDRLREAVFSSLGPAIEHSHVADLFAGTGSYGLEALSRGAIRVVFFENDRSALNCLRQNIQATRHSLEAGVEVAQIRNIDVYSIRAETQRFDWIFIDPPYTTIQWDMPRLFANTLPLLAYQNTRVVLEAPGDLTPAISGWTCLRRIGKIGKEKPTALIYQPNPKSGSHL